MIAELPEPRNPVEIKGRSVLLLYPRHPWQLWKRGWHKHTDFFNRRCWIRYNWPEELQP